MDNPTGDKWQLKTLFLESFDPRLLIVSIAAYTVCLQAQ